MVSKEKSGRENSFALGKSGILYVVCDHCQLVRVKISIQGLPGINLQAIMCFQMATLYLINNMPP